MLLFPNLKEGGDIHLFSARKSCDFTLCDKNDVTVIVLASQGTV